MKYSWMDETLPIEYRTAWFMWDFDFWSLQDCLPMDLDSLEEDIEYIANLHREEIATSAESIAEYLTEIAETLEEKERAAALQMIALINPAA